MVKLESVIIVWDERRYRENLRVAINILEREGGDITFIFIGGQDIPDMYKEFGRVRRCPTEFDVLVFLEKKLAEQESVSDLFILEDYVRIYESTIEYLKLGSERRPMVQMVSPFVNADRFLSFECFDESTFLSNYAEKDSFFSEIYYLDYQGCVLISKSVIGLQYTYDFKEYGIASFLEDFYSVHNRRGFSAVFATSALAFIQDQNRLKGLCSPQFEEKYPDFSSRYSNMLFRHPSYFYLNCIYRKNGKRKIAFDLTVLGDDGRINGTFIAAKSIIKHAIAELQKAGYSCFVVAYQGAIDSYKLRDMHDGIVFMQPEHIKRFYFDVMVRTAQPNALREVERCILLAKKNIFVIQDIISRDCLHYGAYIELNKAYNYLAEYSDALVFISDYSRKIYEASFPTTLPAERVRVIHHSLDAGDYSAVKRSRKYLPSEVGDDKYIFIVGNELPHKAVKECVDELQSLRGYKIVSIGGADNKTENGIVYLKSGYLEPDAIDALYSNAEFVVYPSLYEGFGFPVFEALAQSKVVFVKENPLADEIKIAIKDKNNIRFYRSYADLRQQIASGRSIAFEKLPEVHWNWETVGKAYCELIESVVDEENESLVRSRSRFWSFFYSEDKP